MSVHVDTERPELRITKLMASIVRLCNCSFFCLLDGCLESLLRNSGLEVGHVNATASLPVAGTELLPQNECDQVLLRLSPRCIKYKVKVYQSSVEQLQLTTFEYDANGT